MKQNITAYDWEDEFEDIKNVYIELWLNNDLIHDNVFIKKISFHRDVNDELNILIETNIKLFYDIIKIPEKIFNGELILKIKRPAISYYDEIILINTIVETQNYFMYDEKISYQLKSKKIIFNTNDKEALVLKEWYGCHNKLNYFGINTSKVIDEKITYKDNNKISYILNSKYESYSQNVFFVKTKDFKFKVGMIHKDIKKNIGYNKYFIEYRKKWGKIPTQQTREEIEDFLSYIIGTNLIKLSETKFDDKYIINKKYICPTPLDRSLLFLYSEPFYNTDYRKNDTNKVIEQLPKLLRNYFELKDKYRLQEVFASLYTKSYINFNFINYVTYIEMFANINQKSKRLNTVIPKDKFNDTLIYLNSLNKIPKRIKEKFDSLNIIGIGKKCKNLLKDYKIPYDRYKNIFVVRGKLVHGAKVNWDDVFIENQKAKELLNILILKKLKYKGYIRNFVNNEELIKISDVSFININMLPKE